MAKIYDNILELVGHTPLVRFHALEKKYSAQANIIGKLEFFNPSFSSKARIAKNMIEEAEKSGEVQPFLKEQVEIQELVLQWLPQQKAIRQ